MIRAYVGVVHFLRCVCDIAFEVMYSSYFANNDNAFVVMLDEDVC